MANYYGIGNVSTGIYTDRYQTDISPQNKSSKAKESSFSSVLKNSAKDNTIKSEIQTKNGTDLAIKELSEQLAKQFVSIMFREVYANLYENSDISTGEIAFRQELDDARIKGSDLWRNIAQQIYDEVRET